MKVAKPGDKSQKSQYHVPYTSLTGALIGGVLGHGAAKRVGLGGQGLLSRFARGAITASGALAGSDIVASARAANMARLEKEMRKKGK